MNKKLRKVLVVTMLSITFLTPLAQTVNAFDGTVNVPVQEVLNSTTEEMTPGTEITFSDREVYEAAKSLGYDVDMSVLRARANGVNKIVWRKDGGFDLYVTKNTLLLGSGAAIGALSVILAPLAPAVVTVVGSAISMYAGGNITNGRVFRFKKSMIGKYDYKYTYYSSWAQ